MFRRAPLILLAALASCRAPSATELRAHNNRAEESDAAGEGDSDDDDDDDDDEQGVEVTKPKADVTKDCDQAIREYLDLRDRSNRCRRDNDCAEVWPGLCPHGAYYVDRYARSERLFEHEQAIQDSCTIPECEPPPRLGIAHCQAGRCVAGRAPGKDPSCVDIPVDFLEAGPAQTIPVGDATPASPRVAIGMPARGTIHLEIDWKRCPGCTLALSQLNPIGGLPVGSKRIRKGSVETIDVDAIRATYFLHVKPDPERTGSASGSIQLRAQLRGLNDKPLVPNQHGHVYLRHCDQAPKTKAPKTKRRPTKATKPPIGAQ